MKSRSAFTLIELLVVIAIVAVLAGMLLPAISAIRETAKSTKCMNRMRQVAMAITSYVDNSDGMIPYKILDSGNEILWGTTLANNDYLERFSDAACPGYGPIDATKAGYSWYSYGFRWQTPLNGKNIYEDPYPNPPGPYYYRMVFWNRITVKAAYALLTDTCSSKPPNSYHEQFAAWYISGGSNGISEGLIHFRHRNMANMMFADGHTECLSRQAVANYVTTEYANPAQEIWAMDSSLTPVKISP